MKLVERTGQRGQAIYSPDESYRYVLERRLDSQSDLFSTFEHDRVVMILLNPSTATEDEDDPTIRRCLGFARLHQARSLTILNLYAFRATNPDDLKDVDDPVGPLNDQFLEERTRGAELVIAGWGTIPYRTKAGRLRVASVIKLLRRASEEPIYAFKRSLEGHPQHPLYLPSDRNLEEYLYETPA